MIQLERIRRIGQPLPPTARQIESLRAYITHGTHAAAAAAMRVSERTVKNHLAALRQRLGVYNTAQVVYVMWLGYRDHLVDCSAPSHDDCMPDMAELTTY